MSEPVTNFEARRPSAEEEANGETAPLPAAEEVHEADTIRIEMAEPRSKARPRGLERRVEALETAVAELRDTEALEERIYQRVVKRLPGAEPAGSGLKSWLGRINPFRAAEASIPVSSSWLIWDMFSEARFLMSMIADSRFHMAWASRVGLIVCLVLIATANWWFPLSWFPVIGYWLDKLMTLLLAFFLFKILARETQRYRAFLQSRS